MFFAACKRLDTHTLQDALSLDISGRFYSQWIGQQWGRWRSWADNLGLPSALWVRSEKSVAAVRRSSKATLDAAQLPEFAVGLPCALLLLCRWSATLRSASALRARKTLATLLSSWPKGSLFWRLHLGTSLPGDILPYGGGDGSDCLKLRIDNGQVFVDGLLTSCRRLGQAAARTFI